MDEGLRLEPHDRRWSDRFATERERVRNLAPEGLLGVFHVGSTAVPDLAAKPLVDVLAVYADPSAMRDAAAAMCDAGYVRERDDATWQVLERSDAPVVVHLRPRADDAWRDQLVFREFLRASAAARREYERAKREAMAAHPADVSAYTDAKEETILKLTARAYERGFDDRLPSFE